MSFLDDIHRTKRQIRAEFGPPILRIELGRKQLAELQARTRISDSGGSVPCVYGVPYYAMPVDDWFRIVREGDDD